MGFLIPKTAYRLIELNLFGINLSAQCDTKSCGSLYTTVYDNVIAYHHNFLLRTKRNRLKKLSEWFEEENS